MSQSLDRLYELLPAVYRRRDAEQGYPLQALLRVIAEQVNVVEDDIAQLYENWFIETCQDWVVPYIGDLSGYRLVHAAGEPGDVTTLEGKQLNQILIPRREVANTIGFRRRKGTLALLELLANDVAGWPARAVEFYRRLSWTQPLNHQHPARGRTVELRNGAALDRVDGPFDTLAHTVEVRRIAAPLSQGRYNIPSVGVFVWRLKPYSVTYTHAYCLEEMAPHCYTFSVLGNDTPLYNRPQPEPEPTHIAGELNLPTPIRRRAFEQRVIAGGRIVSTQASDAYYGPDKSLAIWAPDWPKKGAEQPVPAQAIIPADLSQWHYRAPRNHVAVDPELGRIVFPAGQLPKQGVWVSYQYAFSADIGGGEYDRPLSQPSIPTVSLFRSDDLEDPQALAVRLGKTATPDPVSRYLGENFSSTTQQLLNAYDGIGQPSATLQAALLEELNQRLTDAALYDEQRFAGIDPGPEATALLALNPTGQQLLRLNRLLLEAAYPGILARSYLIYRVDRNGSLVEALQRWQSDHPRHAVIEITVSGVYVERLPLLQLRQGQDLQIRAANGARPVIRLLDYQTDLPDSLSVQGATGSRFTLDGLLITGRSLQLSGPEVDASLPPVQGDLCSVTIRHCTLVPGWSLHCDCEPKRCSEPSLELLNTGAHIRIEHSIVGSIQVVANEVRADPVQIDLSDSILDATSEAATALGAPGLPLAYAVLNSRRCTVIGQIQTHAIALAENCILLGQITVGRRQQGCMRCCYVVPGSRTPRRYQCQPDLAEQAAEVELRKTARQMNQPDPAPAEIQAARQCAQLRVEPQFNSTRYGTPTYCQLADACADEIRRGADDESEMGVFHDLYQPQRAANLRTRLDEYTPAGMEAGLIYAS